MDYLILILLITLLVVMALVLFNNNKQKILEIEKLLTGKEEITIDASRGNKTEIGLEFIHKPEYLSIGDIFIFREGKTRGIGKVLSLEKI